MMQPSRLMAIDRPTGAVLWCVELSGRPTASPAVTGSRVFLGLSDALEIRSLVDGRLLSRTAHELGGVSGGLRVRDGRFSYITGQGKLVIGRSDDGQVLATSAEARRGTHPLVARQKLLLVGPQFLTTVHKNSLTDLPNVWCDQVHTDQITSPPVLHDGSVYVGTRDRGLVCIRGAR